jgi:hypothetical protein
MEQPQMCKFLIHNGADVDEVALDCEGIERIFWYATPNIVAVTSELIHVIIVALQSASGPWTVT